jgi:hypothetical protein
VNSGYAARDKNERAERNFHTVDFEELIDKPLRQLCTATERTRDSKNTLNNATSLFNQMIKVNHNLKGVVNSIMTEES